MESKKDRALAEVLLPDTPTLLCGIEYTFAELMSLEINTVT